ncbi:hypothetical protein L226DRAFT_613557 [Lentinus tigrinus ALCF2SS1-7]|uniref:F-box domain-containing protein n=1 Tax=Lentinus tigrinus ALCF2SS1-6 TaxID=1328759 RepID=A0A5C2RTD3_9APHY|nr:hypothetical protein L227DRAFT_657289 [Lentinus tigrinus ALCF2SS1-6]RPD74164.1 hypothetical protein L226DRAFT_613557 [Lentinus tigrinus ALCF2SS1-7]
MQHDTVVTELIRRPLADIAQELAALRADKARLQDEVDGLNALMPELHTLRKENVERRKALGFFIRQTEFIPRVDSVRLSGPRTQELPSDIIAAILDALVAVSPPYEHKPDIVLGPRSPWMDHIRFQKGLTLVCKAWWEPATRVLYNRVVLRRMGQITAFARTLSETNVGYDFARHVKHIALHDCAILNPFSDVVLEDLRFVLRRCTAVQSFTVAPHMSYSSGMWRLPGSSLDIGWMSQESLRSLVRKGPIANLRHLELPLDRKSRLAIVELYHILFETKQLLSLKLELLDFRTPPEDDVELSTLPTLSLPLLCELQFSTRCEIFTDWVTSSCKMPNLRSLTLTKSDSIPLSFLEAHGGRLTYINCNNFDSQLPNSNHLTDLRSLAETCPMVEHLVVCHAFDVVEVLFVLHRARQPLLHLRYLDIWLTESWRGPVVTQEKLVDSFARYDKYHRKSGAKREKFPVLGTNARYLSYYGHTDLPRICHPAALSGDDEVRTVRVHDACIVQTLWLVQEKEGDVWPGHPESDDQSNDSDFVPESEDEDTTSWISDDASDNSAEADSGLDDGSEDTHDTWTEDQVLKGLSCKALPEQWDAETINSDMFPGEGPSRSER